MPTLISREKMIEIDSVVSFIMTNYRLLIHDFVQSRSTHALPKKNNKAKNTNKKKNKKGLL